jgi:hypothetical protein
MTKIKTIGKIGLNTKVKEINLNKFFNFDEFDPKQMRYVAERLNVLSGISDPLDLVSDHKDREIIQHLRKNGIEGSKVRDILMASFGFSVFNGSIAYSIEEASQDKKILDTIRNINALCKNSLLTKVEVSTLRKIVLRLKNKSFRYSRDTIERISFRTSDSGSLETILFLGSSGSRAALDSFEIKMKKDKAVMVMPSDGPHAKTRKQVIGFRLSALFDYFQKFNHEQFSDKEIYGLIFGLYNKTWGTKYEAGQIKKMIDNNKTIYKNINSSERTTKSKNIRTSIKS